MSAQKLKIAKVSASGAAPIDANRRFMHPVAAIARKIVCVAVLFMGSYAYAQGGSPSSAGATGTSSQTQSLTALIGQPLYPTFVIGARGCRDLNCNAPQPLAFTEAIVDDFTGQCSQRGWSESGEFFFTFDVANSIGLDRLIVIDSLEAGEDRRVQHSTYSAILHPADSPTMKFNIVFTFAKSPTEIRKDCFLTREERAAKIVANKRIAQGERATKEEAEQKHSQSLQSVPRAGKPTYAETAQWLITNLPKIASSPSVKSMDKCLIKGDSDLTIPLNDVEFVADAPGTGYFSGPDLFFTFSMKHGKDQYIAHAQDYDSMLLAQRALKALKHAVSLCSKPDPKPSGPF